MAVLADVHGNFPALQAVLASLGPADRKSLEGLLTVGWYDFELGKKLDDAIVAVVGKGDPAFFRRLGRASADKNLTSLHKSFVTAGDPHGFLGAFFPLPPDKVSRVAEDGHEPDDGVGLLEPALQLRGDVARAFIGEKHVHAFLEPLDREGQPALAPHVDLVDAAAGFRHPTFYAIYDGRNAGLVQVRLD